MEMAYTPLKKSSSFRLYLDERKLEKETERIFFRPNPEAFQTLGQF